MEGGIKGVVHDQICNLAVGMSVVVKCWSASYFEDSKRLKDEGKKGQKKWNTGWVECLPLEARLGKAWKWEADGGEDLECLTKNSDLSVMQWGDVKFLQHDHYLYQALYSISAMYPVLVKLFWK